MPAKKASAAKKPSAGKPATRRIGLTSAIGPKATTAVVICVLAGGLAIGARQQAARSNALRAVAEPLLAADTTVAPATSSSSPAKSSKPARATASSPDAESERPAITAKATGVTISGCLERADSGFRLTSTEGAGAPKSRSWKSGFLKKGSASLDVVDPSHDLPLSGQVGHRVSVTGTLVDREMHADSVRRVSGSCKAG